MPNFSSVRRAFLETAHGRIDGGIARPGRPVLLLHQTLRSSDEYPHIISGSCTVPIPGGMVPVVDQMPEACAAAVAGFP